MRESQVGDLPLNDMLIYKGHIKNLMFVYILLILLISLVIDCKRTTYRSPIVHGSNANTALSQLINRLALSSLPLSIFLTSRQSRADILPNTYDRSITFDEAVKVIQNNCSLWLDEVRESGRLLYRGEPTVLGNNPILRQRSEYDLLNPKTFEENGIVAADYFKALDQYLSIDPRPSHSHIGTSDINEASKWGPVCSIWPVGAVHFVYLKSYSKFWQDEWCTPQSTDRPIAFWRDSTYLSAFVDSEFIRDTRLSSALSAEKEVMFSSKSDAYLAVPLLLEAKLLRALDIKAYEPTIMIIKTKPMQVEGQIKRRVNVPPREMM